jgi:23S rRNA (adenine2030-N6)-methyltransferase
MNYRHAFHAGNFADVLKHAVLCRILVYLRQKPAAFRVLDTHAGAGRFDLAGNEASRTGEWRAGIGRLLTASLAPQAAELLAPYLDIVRQANSDAANSEQPNSEQADSGGPLRVYPGSPLIAQALLRSQDRLVSCELEPGAVTALGRHLGGDRRAKAVEIDGWTALGAYLPPPERRGVVLIDPPFEKPDEFSRLATGLTAAYRKWPGGSYMLWYPIKDYDRCVRGAAAPTRYREIVADRTGERAGVARRRAQRQRSRRGQSALHAAGRDGHSASRNARCPGAGWTRQLAPRLAGG